MVDLCPCSLRDCGDAWDLRDSQKLRVSVLSTVCLEVFVKLPANLFHLGHYEVSVSFGQS